MKAAFITMGQETKKGLYKLYETVTLFLMHTMMVFGIFMMGYIGISWYVDGEPKFWGEDVVAMYFVILGVMLANKIVERFKKK